MMKRDFLIFYMDYFPETRKRYCHIFQMLIIKSVRRGADMLSMISYAEENGIKKGEKIGEKKGESRLGALMNILLKNKRYADAEKASEDEVYREQLYREYKL